MDVVIDGGRVSTEADLHRILATQMELGDYYGKNLAALRDSLLANVPRPVRLIWKRSEASRRNLGAAVFDKIIDVLDEAQEQDRAFGWDDRFEYRPE